MAINKNFVIKNGVQVSTDLIIGDADTNKVGIGTTVPGSMTSTLVLGEKVEVALVQLI